jgi:hypothetical protein
MRAVTERQHKCGAIVWTGVDSDVMGFEAAVDAHAFLTEEGAARALSRDRRLYWYHQEQLWCLPETDSWPEAAVGSIMVEHVCGRPAPKRFLMEDDFS